MNFFAGNTPEINGYLPEKPAICPQAAIDVHQNFFKGWITQVGAGACAQQPLRMRLW